MKTIEIIKKFFYLNFYCAKQRIRQKKTKGLLRTELHNKELTVIINKQRAMPTVIILRFK